MPKKSKPEQRQPWEVDFVRCELDKAQREHVKLWDVKGEATFDEISRLVFEGYKLTFSADKSHDCVAGYLTSPKSTDGSRQQCLGARGPDLFSAMRALIFKHSVILQGDWGTPGDTDWKGDAWG